MKGLFYRIKRRGALVNQILPVLARTKLYGTIYDVMKYPGTSLLLLSSTSKKYIDHNNHMFERIGASEFSSESMIDMNTNYWTWLHEVISLEEKLTDCRRVYVSTKDLDYYVPGESYEWGLRTGNYTMPYSTRLFRKTK
jgi:hypothetical protein